MFAKKEKKTVYFEPFKDPLYRGEELVIPGLERVFDIFRKKR